MGSPPSWSSAIIISALCVFAVSNSIFPNKYTDEFGRGPVLDAAAVGYGCDKAWNCLKRSFESVIAESPHRNVCDDNGNTCQGTVVTAIYKKQTVIIISFGGSSDIQLQTEIANLTSTVLWPYGQGQVGYYFYQAFNNIVLAPGTIANAVSDATTKHPSAEILITGHSLGGSLASLMARYLVFIGIPAERLFLVTLAEPRLGNLEFAHDFNTALKRSARVTTRFDPIPTLPFDGFAGIKYAAHGHRIYYEDGTLGNNVFVDCETATCPPETITNLTQACHHLPFHLMYFVPRIDLYGRHHCAHGTPMPILSVNCTVPLPGLGDYHPPHELPEFKDENLHAQLHNPDTRNKKPELAHP
ncbi:hypothetical protein QR680_014641 [Steinernema hermaphroditum]|uniref:Fungal lipase-type domain-containing protein n=1 Tax=Steinernema hermaphroditum TaxID=289476 RepID=A0AA39IB94_9BILA|nr:hypothetical protein QR680_014641 [Steinernema hermaphroditum]